MSNLTSKLTLVLLSPLYLLAMLLGVVFALLAVRPELVNWAAQRLGLQLKPGLKGGSFTGPEGILGAVAEVTVAFHKPELNAASKGKVVVRGEIWNAVLPPEAKIPQVGEKVFVEAVEGLTLIVVGETNNRSKQRPFKA